MRAVADESIDGQIVRRLRSEAHEIVYVAELYAGLKDDDVLARAYDSEALLITADKDFGELIFRQGRAAFGVLLLRLAGLTPNRKADLVARAFADRGSELVGAFSVLTEHSIRIRKAR